MKGDTRERMLQATTELVQQRGLHGASLNEILDRSGTPRGSLYYHFPGGKDQLVREATLASVERITSILEELMGDGEDPAGKVRSYIEAAAEELKASGYVFGCPVAPIVFDVTGDSELAELCRETLGTWERILREGFERAGIAGKRAVGLATLVVSALEGALILARSEQSTRPLAVVADELVPLIAGAVGG